MPGVGFLYFFFSARTMAQRELRVSERAWHLPREIETGQRRARPETVAESISVSVKHVCVEWRTGNKNSEYPLRPTPVTDNHPCYNIVLIPGWPCANIRRVVRHERMRRDTHVGKGSPVNQRLFPFVLRSFAVCRVFSAFCDRRLQYSKGL